jgi:hypothetical protein
MTDVFLGIAIVGLSLLAITFVAAEIADARRDQIIIVLEQSIDTAGYYEVQTPLGLEWREARINAERLKYMLDTLKNYPPE